MVGKINLTAAISETPYSSICDPLPSNNNVRKMAHSLSIVPPFDTAGRLNAKPIQIPTSNGQSLASSSPSQGAALSFRNGHLNLNTFSPVNENGSFEFDRVLKRGKVSCKIKSRHAFKSSWKPGYLVLRPNLLSVYKDEDEAILHLSITLSEVTAVAPVHSPRSTRDHVFGVFSPSKNHRFQTVSESDARDWIERIRSEVRVDEEEEDEEAILAESKQPNWRRRGITSEVEDHLAMTASEHSDVDETDHDITSSSPELVRTFSFGVVGKQLPLAQDYSGNEVTEYSDLSDGPGGVFRQQQRSVTSLPAAEEWATSAASQQPADGTKRPSIVRDTSRINDLGPLGDPERVICHGYLQCLRSKRGVRQWKKLWVVLRPISLALYKDEREYCAIRIIPMSQVVNAAEIDPISRSKNFCLQIITEDRPIYRLCAPDEESLAKWLGAFKSILIARKKAIEKKKAAGTAAAAPPAMNMPTPSEPFQSLH